MKCQKCGKRVKENTDGDLRYCQGHDIFETTLKRYPASLYSPQRVTRKTNQEA